MLYKLRDMGVKPEHLLQVYLVKICHVTEYACQVFGTFLNGLQAKTLEDLQANACLVILGSSAQSYAKNLIRLAIPTLAARREELIREFAISTFRNQKHRWWYSPSPPPSKVTRQEKPRYRFLLPNGKTAKLTARLEHSPITVYTKILNSLWVPQR